MKKDEIKNVNVRKKLTDFFLITVMHYCNNRKQRKFKNHSCTVCLSVIARKRFAFQQVTGDYMVRGIIRRYRSVNVRRIKHRDTKKCFFLFILFVSLVQTTKLFFATFITFVLNLFNAPVLEVHINSSPHTRKSNACTRLMNVC